MRVPLLTATCAAAVLGALRHALPQSAAPLGRTGQRTHDALYWEFHAQGGSQTVRLGRWKGVREEVARRSDAPIELYDLQDDENETKDVAAENPDVVRRIAALMRTSRMPAVLD